MRKSPPAWTVLRPQPTGLLPIPRPTWRRSAFDLLKRVSITAPIIFTTAYDEYALAAFKTKSIDYLLKPVKAEELAAALDKLSQMKQLFAAAGGGAPETEERATHTGRAGEKAGLAGDYKKRFVIRIGEQLKTLAAEDIAYCYSESKATYARASDGRNLPMDYNLDALEHMLDPQVFFRINRQYLISLQAIEDMRAYTKSRVVIKLKPAAREHPVVSAERSADFKAWLGGEL